MSPRPNRRRPSRGGPDPAWAGERVEEGPDGVWMVRPVTGAGATKRYRCPGCDHELHPGTPHVVAWPAEGPGAVADRRHWHTACWEARTRRARLPVRPRRGPRY